MDADEDDEPPELTTPEWRRLHEITVDDRDAPSPYTNLGDARFPAGVRSAVRDWAVQDVSMQACFTGWGGVATTSSIMARLRAQKNNPKNSAFTAYICPSTICEMVFSANLS